MLQLVRDSRVTTDRRWSGERSTSTDRQCGTRERLVRNDRGRSGAASADSSGVRSPLRRKLVRTLVKNRGLTTDSLIEGEREKGRKGVNSS
jgi:hypothetical protein